VLIIEALWFIFPAYLANSAPVDVSQIKALKKYGTPIDGGKTFRGKRVLGDSKTWRGLYAGVIAGTGWRGPAGGCSTQPQRHFSKPP